MSAPETPAAGTPAATIDPAHRDDLFQYLLRQGDDRLVLGHRLSEWCGHGPILEEDIAIANIALDLIGQATSLLGLAGEVEGAGRDADQLAYFRDAIDYRNVQLVELPKGDFATTIARQFFFDVYDVLVTRELQRSALPALAGIAGKAHKEARYHVRHTGEWMLRLGDGTDESHARAQRAVDELWRFTGELFEADAVDERLHAAGLVPDVRALAPEWRAQVERVLAAATLRVPEEAPYASGGRRGRHTEFLGHMLTEMQIVARSHPGAKW